MAVSILHRATGLTPRQTLFQPLDAVERQTAAVFEERDHRRGAVVVLCLADAWRGVGGKHGATQAATQPFEFVDLREQRRYAGYANQDRGLSSLPIDPTGTPVDGTRIAVP